MLAREAVAAALMDNEVSTVFGLCGDGNVHLMTDFVSRFGGNFYHVTHEAAGVMAASGFAQVTQGLGVATVTRGPALTNALTPLTEAARQRLPLLLVAGATAVVDHHNGQNLEQREAVLPTGAGFEQIRAPHTVGEDVTRAIRRAYAERRPIVLNVPVDLQHQEADYVRTIVQRFPLPSAVAPDPAAVENAVGIIASARRPVVLAGRGAASPSARAALVELAERIGAPLATTVRGMDLFAGHRHNIGIMGTVSHDLAGDVLARADTIIAFGAGLNINTAGGGGFLTGRRVIHVDIDPGAFGRYTQPTATVLGDSATVAEAMLVLLSDVDLPPTRFADDDLAQKLAQFTDGHEDVSAEDTVDMRTVLRRVDAAFPRDRVLVTDGGRFVLATWRDVHVSRPVDYVHTVAFGSIGLGMGHAIGAAVGSGRPTLLINGDGGFMMGGLAEFNTAVRYGLDLVVVLLNDGAYGAELSLLREHPQDSWISRFQWPEFAPLANDLGGTGYTVRDLNELDAAISALPERTGPVLIDVKVDPDKVAVPM